MIKVFIKFHREARYEPRGLTNQRLAAAKRKFKKEQERLPLFANEIAEQQTTAESYVLSKEEQIIKHEQDRRNNIANNWRRGRKVFYSMPVDIRRECIRKWNENRFKPKTALYFLMMLHTHFKEYCIEDIKKAA